MHEKSRPDKADCGPYTESDPALTEQLESLAAIANEAGAEGVFILRGATDASLTYTPQGELRQIQLPKLEATTSLSLTVPLADAGVLVIIRFPAGDGQDVGVEFR